MNAIEVRNLKKYFGKVKAVDDISFDVRQGEIFGFLGPNGAGKTTTIRCMMDFLRPDTGTATIFQMDSQQKSVALKARIGCLPADVQLYGKWTGKDHATLLASFHAKPSEFQRLAERFDFDPSVKVKNLSTGNKQKLGIILALMSAPDLLILDEPTRGLDPLLQNAIYEELREFRKRGGTIFMSSHNLHEVEHVCDRAAIIKNGKLVAVEEINTLTRKKVHLVTAEFALPFQKSDFQLEHVEFVSEHTTGFSVKVTGDLNPVMKQLALHDVRDLEITHASLEEAFFDLYNHEHS
jgi:ABC-2 type transport system ATP-binding protein